MLIPLAVLCTFTVFFVGWEIVQRHVRPELSIGWQHAMLTVRAAVVTAAASITVFALMRRQQRRLSATAADLHRILEARQQDPSAPVRFENPHLIHCRTVVDCDQADCPMYDAPGERCWQTMALKRSEGADTCAAVVIEGCHDCVVYRTSCPDKLIEVGESFNNLMFLLEREARQVSLMQAQMVEKEKMVAVGEIAAGIAHEVGNPLSSISSIVQMLRRNGAVGPAADQLGLIDTHIQRILTIVQQLVSFSKPSAEQWESVDVCQVLDEAVRLIKFDRRARDVETILDGPTSLPTTYGLKGQLQQVFINLALNALDAMPEGGRLTIRPRELHGNIIVSVEDTGSGIAPETGRRVFELFFTTKEPGRGTGLGLAVSYGIVQKHGGTVSFRSTMGEGTVFTVELPILYNPPDA
ncbi:MAG: hypothetical protein GY842_22065 [bacterium]|nr:hypothetical protein [bacterium]